MHKTWRSSGATVWVIVDISVWSLPVYSPNVPRLPKITRERMQCWPKLEYLTLLLKWITFCDQVWRICQNYSITQKRSLTQTLGPKIDKSWDHIFTHHTQKSSSTNGSDNIVLKSNTLYLAQTTRMFGPNLDKSKRYMWLRSYRQFIHQNMDLTLS